MRQSVRVLCCLLAMGGAAAAQPAEDGKRAPAATRPVPPDAVSDHAISLPGRTLHFTATAGFVRIVDEKAAPEADIAMTAYTLPGADPGTRPVTFVINGGPGMSSAWLQMGAVGPWRVPMVTAPSATAVPQPNADTWLDFTDLVFVDPVGTGYSHFDASDDDVRKRLWSVDGDISALSQAMRRWLDKVGRIASPKYLLGESYGGFRGPRLARRLAESDGVGLRGLVLVSPVLDFGNHSAALDVLGYAAGLPSKAAAVMAARGQAVVRADLAEAEAYASGPFIADVLRGVADPQALDRVVQRVSALTGVDPAIVRQRRGLIDDGTFVHEHDRASARIDSLYDTTVSLPDAHPEYPYGRSTDPMLDGLRAPLTSGMLAVYDMLHWHPDGEYKLFSQDAGTKWDYGNGWNKPESLDPLRVALALDPGLHVIIAHGLYDLVCPYFGTALLLNQIPPTAGADRVKLVTYPGGHMFYSRDESRAALRGEVATMIGGGGA